MANKRIVAIHVSGQYVETARMRKGASSASTRTHGYMPSMESHRRLTRVLNHYMAIGRISSVNFHTGFGEGSFSLGIR